MTSVVEAYDAGKLWLAGVGGAILALVVGALLFPKTVYDGFIWRYFWGPVVADGEGVTCAERIDGTTVLHETAQACALADGTVAEPGYTVISTVGYGLVLLVALVGVYLALERYDVGRDRYLFYAMIPFVFFGGTMRVIEDAVVAMPAETTAFVPSFPLTALLISPIIYFLIFVIAAIAIAIGIVLRRGEFTESSEWPAAILGGTLFVLSLAYLAYLTANIPAVDLSVAMFIVTLGGATLVTIAVWIAIERIAPVVNAGTGLLGAVVIWGHAVDGFANVLSLDWADELGLALQYEPKHVINQLVMDVTDAVQPTAISDAIGTVWPFLFLKVGVAVFVVYIFDERMMAESPRFSYLLLLAILAVGLGPGTRDLLRAGIGI